MISFKSLIHSGEDLDEQKQIPKGEYATEKYQRILKEFTRNEKKIVGLGGNDYLVKGTKEKTLADQSLLHQVGNIWETIRRQLSVVFAIG